jgi:hypothetical protein
MSTGKVLGIRQSLVPRYVSIVGFDRVAARIEDF